MSRQTIQKQERVIEAVRQGLVGMAAVEFIHQSGFAITVHGIARHLKSLGGREKIESLIRSGMSNSEILKQCVPEADAMGVPAIAPTQPELFVDITHENPADPFEEPNHHLYDTVKISVRLPADVYEAVRLAARATQKTQNELIVEILTRSLSRMPEQLHHLD